MVPSARLQRELDHYPVRHLAPVLPRSRTPQARPCPRRVVLKDSISPFAGREIARPACRLWNRGHIGADILVRFVRVGATVQPGGWIRNVLPLILGPCPRLIRKALCS